jgi:hypothetical protein
MKLITEFKDVDGFDVTIVAQNVFSTRRMTKQSSRGGLETVIEVQSAGGAIINVVEGDGKNFMVYLAERLE